MAYTALYRKFRPKEFEDVKGQDAIITTLKNQIMAKRIGHAYLFCGTRGTGKTTVAKIFAKAVNCESPIEGSPCGICKMCTTIAAGTSLNVIEIDAASNNGVDNIREIRDEVAYRPAEGIYKVYIIDEVHMLSIGAFNALLKTLEEPPEYVIFILATTESHKIPVTILSRCQRYDFKRITIDIIAKRLRDLMQEEQVEVEEKALRYIAKVADGSMRDGLSLLDQCIAFYIGENLTYEHVLEVIGAVDTDVFSKLLREILEKDIVRVLEHVDELIMQGRELTQLTVDFTWYLRNLILVKNSDNMEEVIDVSAENWLQLKEESQRMDSDTILRYIRIFADLSNQLKYATQKRVLLEVAFIKLCKPEMEISQDSLIARIHEVEERISELQVKGIQVEKTRDVSEQVVERESLKKQVLDLAIPDEVKRVVEQFRDIASKTNGLLSTTLKKARLSLGGGDKLLIVMPDELSFGIVAKDSSKEEIQKLIEARIGKSVTIEVGQVEKGRVFEDSFQDIEQKIHMDITVED